MKLSRTLLTCLVVVLPCLVLSDPQRRKREIMAEILAEAVEAVGRQERSPPAGHGHPANAQHHESPQHRGSSHLKRSADPQISQNCAGGVCNQNNIAAAGHGSAGYGSAGHGSAGHGTTAHSSAGFASSGFAGFFPSIAQNCINGVCNQNNVLRRKREVLTHLIEEARKIVEEEVEAEEAISRRKREEGLNDDGCLVGPSGEKVCQHGAYGSDGESRVQARGNQGPGFTGSNGNAGPVSAAGLAYDPAAETYKQQILAYQAWAEQQVENAKGQLGTA